MGTTIIACYRPKPGKRPELLGLLANHVARLYRQGLVSRRQPFLMEAMDGTILEVFEWKSQQAIEDAHHDPVVIAMWGEFAQVCDHVPLAKISEASRPFSGFTSLELAVERPALARLFNQVQLTGNIGSSGLVDAEAIETMAAEGYRAVINLLPDTSEHALAGEAELVAALGMDYTYIPVDFAAPTDEDMARFETAMEANAESKVWVHCAANYRVSAFLSVYARRHLGWPRRRAEELLAEVWTPDATWQTFLDRQA